jgi:hypothetical protein
LISRNSRPRRPSEQVSSVELLNDLLISLRDVMDSEKVLAEFAGGREPEGPEFDKARALIHRVSKLYHMLEKRSEDLSEPLEELSAHSGIDMKELLLDCLEFPQTIPYVRDLTGLRRLFLCFCGKREAVDHEGLGLCNPCLYAALDCVIDKKKSKGFILYRAYSPEVRCRHADFNTVLITLYKEGHWFPAWCEMCLLQEKQRILRKQSFTTADVG